MPRQRARKARDPETGDDVKAMPVCEEPDRAMGTIAVDGAR